MLLQYAATRPLFDMLLTAYPQFLRPDWFDYEGYLWAAELFYSYAFEVGGGAMRAAAVSLVILARGVELKKRSAVKARTRLCLDRH